jgi:hypothetical protein
MNSVTEFLVANWGQLSLEQYGRPQLSTLVLTPGFRASSNVIMLVFNSGGEEPILVAKVARLPGENPAIRHEANNLEKIQSLRDGGFDSVPRLVVLSEDEDYPFLVETMLAGSLMGPATVRQHTAACTETVLTWLIELGIATATVGDLGWFERLVTEPFVQFRRAMATSTREDQLLGKSWDAVLPLGAHDLPLVFEHGDPSDPNLLKLKNGDVGVVDWELAQANSLPLVDVIFFLTYVAFSRRNAKKPSEYVAAFHEAFFGPSAWATPFVLRYARSINLPKRALTPLFVLCWVRYLAKLMGRLCPHKGQALPSETVAWLRANRYYSLWQHSVEHAHELNWIG